MIIFVIVMGLVWGLVCSRIAAGKHRDGFGWFCAGFFLGLIGVIAAAVARPLPDPREGSIGAWR